MNFASHEDRLSALSVRPLAESLKNLGIRNAGTARIVSRIMRDDVHLRNVAAFLGSDIVAQLLTPGFNKRASRWDRRGKLRARMNRLVPALRHVAESHNGTVITRYTQIDFSSRNLNSTNSDQSGNNDLVVVPSRQLPALQVGFGPYVVVIAFTYSPGEDPDDDENGAIHNEPRPYSWITHIGLTHKFPTWDMDVFCKFYYSYYLDPDIPDEYRTNGFVYQRSKNYGRRNVGPAAMQDVPAATATLVTFSRAVQTPQLLVRIKHSRWGGVVAVPVIEHVARIARTQFGVAVEVNAILNLTDDGSISFDKVHGLHTDVELY